MEAKPRLHPEGQRGGKNLDQNEDQDSQVSFSDLVMSEYDKLKNLNEQSG
jgi:hypothetical protein